MKRVVILILMAGFFVYGCSHSHRNRLIDLNTHGKYTMLVFDSTTCHYCIKLHHDLKNNKQLKKLASKMTVYFIHVNRKNYYLMHTKVHGDIKLSTMELANFFDFRGSTPYIVITNSKLEPIVTIPGYLKPSMFAQVLEYILSGAYKKMNLKDYLNL